MIVFQVGSAVHNVSRGVVVVIHREDGVVAIHVDAIGGSSLHRDGWSDVPFHTHFYAKASLVDVGHDKVDELTGVGIFACRGVEEHILAVKAAVPDEVLISIVVTRQAELEDR